MQMKTGCEVLNKTLESVGGLTPGQFSTIKVLDVEQDDVSLTSVETRFMKQGHSIFRVSAALRSMGVLVMGKDSITGRDVVLTKKTIGIPVIGGEASTEIYAVHELSAKSGEGLFFVTRTLAECYFGNITGKPKLQELETGGRTLRELADHLFA